MRLYQKIYLALIASLILVVAIAGAFWRFGADDLAGWPRHSRLPASLRRRAAAAGRAPPGPAGGSRTSLPGGSRSISRCSMSSAACSPPPADRCRRRRPGATAGVGHGPDGRAWSFPLPDQRWVVVAHRLRHRHPAIGLVIFLGLIALAVAVCAYPVVRGLTRRLERLQQAVETLGAGNLSARVKVEGRDEVARLAGSFNRAAARIEELVGSHRMLLANASHELRTPLSRIRLGLELFQQTGDPKYRAELTRDIAELDLLLDEILLASRLDAVADARYDGRNRPPGARGGGMRALPGLFARGHSGQVHGDPRLLRRLIRNLIENAKRHGKPPVRVAPCVRKVLRLCSM